MVYTVEIVVSYSLSIKLSELLFKDLLRFCFQWFRK
jgi:hypothetical protein